VAFVGHMEGQAKVQYIVAEGTVVLILILTPPPPPSLSCFVKPVHKQMAYLPGAKLSL